MKSILSQANDCGCGTSSPNVIITYSYVGSCDWCSGSCWEETITFTTVLGASSRECSPIVKETKFLVIPNYVCVPALATVTWNADDDIAVNGFRLRNQCSAGGGTMQLMINERTLKLELIDAVGINWSGFITIKICPGDCK